MTESQRPHGDTPPTTGGQGAPAQPDTTSPLWFGEDTRHGYGHGTPAHPGWTAPPSPPSGGPATSSTPGRGRRWGELVAVAALAAVLASGGTYAATQLGDDAGQTSPTAASSPSASQSSPAPVSQADASNPNWTATADAVAPSVVAITVQTSSGTAQGSGVIFDDKGHVLTNNHVAQGGQNGSIKVTLNDGRTYDATIAGTDPSTDLAVLTIQNPPDDITPVALGDSDSLKVGDPVMAVGNPLGLAGTVTTGIVSALNRPVTTGQQQTDPFSQQQSEPVVTNAIQTSAAINPGNSGGALVNSSGQLVGINSSIATLGSSMGGESGNIGIGFAIPANEAKTIADQLVTNGSAQHAYLGVAPKDGTASDGNATRAGAEIAQVLSGTPAAKAGLRQGDVVIAIDGEPVDSATSLVAYVREKSVGDKVTLTLIRDGQTVQVNATLVARSNNG